MDNVTENEKKSLYSKFLEFQKMGLISYGKYLKVELDNSLNSDIKKAYRKYIENEIQRNSEKIKEVDEKLSS